jgi:FixJ family two-component response regulator
MEERPSVFVVDDDLRVQKALSNLISSAGFRVATFGSASAFLDSERPDCPGCLVLDVNQPGISGLEQ